MKIRGIILAGGKSSRMGRNKLDVILDGRKIIDRVIDNVTASKLEDIVIVYGKYDVTTNLTKIYNPSFEKGMSTSIIEGMKDFNGDGVIIFLGDMPFVSSEIINLLLDAFERGNKSIVIPTHQGSKGNPVIIGRKYFNDLLNNTGDKGAREIINQNLEDVEWVEVESPGVLWDVDDEKTLSEIVNYEL